MENFNGQSIRQQAALAPQVLRRFVDYSMIKFESTEQVEKLTDIVGQTRARTAMIFILGISYLAVSGWGYRKFIGMDLFLVK